MTKVKGTQTQAPAPSLKLKAPTPEGIAVQKRTLGQSWIALPAQTRLRFSAALMAVAFVGIFASDWLEEKIPTPPKDQK